MCYLGAVGMYYAEFPQISDEEVIDLLNEANAK
jgi:predicted phosphoribosyltransferase